jgi:hypothetical protein
MCCWYYVQMSRNEDLDVDGRIILKFIFRMQSVGIWTRFLRHRIGSNSGPLWTMWWSIGFNKGWVTYSSCLLCSFPCNWKSFFTCFFLSFAKFYFEKGPGLRSRYSDSLWTGRLGVRAPVGVSDFLFSITVKIGPGSHPASCTVGMGALTWG